MSYLRSAHAYTYSTVLYLLSEPALRRAIRPRDVHASQQSILVIFFFGCIHWVDFHWHLLCHTYWIISWIIGPKSTLEHSVLPLPYILPYTKNEHLVTWLLLSLRLDSKDIFKWSRYIRLAKFNKFTLFLLRGGLIVFPHEFLGIDVLTNPSISRYLPRKMKVCIN